MCMQCAGILTKGFLIRDDATCIYAYVLTELWRSQIKAPISHHGATKITNLNLVDRVCCEYFLTSYHTTAIGAQNE